VLINPARNPSIFRRQFPIRLWYPSQHLLRQNPLPGSQFGSRRRFPRAASQRQALVRLACRRQRRRGAARPSSRHCAQPFVLSAGDGEFEYRIKSMNEPHERVVRESELQGVWSAYPGGPAAISHRPDPIMIVAAPSLVVELARTEESGIQACRLGKQSAQRLATCG